MKDKNAETYIRMAQEYALKKYPISKRDDSKIKYLRDAVYSSYLEGLYHSTAGDLPVDFKFRGLDENYNWRYGSLLKANTYSDGKINCWICECKDAINIDTLNCIKVFASTVGVFLGVTDSAGVPLYQGDCNRNGDHIVYCATGIVSDMDSDMDSKCGWFVRDKSGDSRFDVALAIEGKQAVFTVDSERTKEKMLELLKFRK